MEKNLKNKMCKQFKQKKKKASLSLLAIVWNSAFSWTYTG